MSTIKLICSEQNKEELKSGIWKLILDHYLTTTFPNSNAEYEYEGKEVYRERMAQLMQDELCRIDDTDDGISVEFDSTEDAGFSIVGSVYGTDMGYSDQGLTFLPPLFKQIAETFPTVCFEADTECVDNWAESYNHYGYDGNVLTIDGVDLKKYELVMSNMSPFADPEEIAKETGLSVDDVTEIIETFC